MTSCRESLSNSVLSKWCKKLAVGTRAGEGWAATPTAPAWGTAKANPGRPKAKLTLLHIVMFLPLVHNPSLRYGKSIQRNRKAQVIKEACSFPCTWKVQKRSSFPQESATPTLLPQALTSRRAEMHLSPAGGLRHTY